MKEPKFKLPMSIPIKDYGEVAEEIRRVDVAIQRLRKHFTEDGLATMIAGVPARRGGHATIGEARRTLSALKALKKFYLKDKPS